MTFLREDSTRPMAQRAKAFLDTYTAKAHLHSVATCSVSRPDASSTE
jgi:hypothetical protein